MSVDPLRELDPPIVVEPSEPASGCVIWLHGLGADGHDFEPIVEQLGRDLTRDVRFVFPHAPQRSVTINNGMMMRAWYDILELDLSHRADESGVRDSGDILRALIERELSQGLRADRIVLAGFSQGGAIALHAGLRHTQALAGIMALSTYLPFPESLDSEATEANRSVPIFMAHGSQDPVIALALSEASRAHLTGLGYVVECHTYPIPHAVCPEEVRDIADWLARVLAKP